MDRLARLATRFLCLLLTLLPLTAARAAQPFLLPPPADQLDPALTTTPYEELLLRMEAQEAELAELCAQVQQQASPLSAETLWEEVDCGTGRELRRLPVVVEAPADSSCEGDDLADYHLLRYYADYDEGFVFRPVDRKKTPFELKINGYVHFRHTGFDRSVETWTDNAGITRPVVNRNYFDLERARLWFSGYAYDPRLTYYVHMDGDSDGRETVDFFYYWWAWEHSDALKIYLGKRKVLGVRQWLQTPRRLRLVDRPMACEFFRPSLSNGLFVGGNLPLNSYYEVMVGDGYDTLNIPPVEYNNRFVYSGTFYSDPLGDYGNQLVDYDWVRTPRVRIGNSFIYSLQDGLRDGVPLEESDFVRLADGTRLVETGALAPGVTISEFDVLFYNVDAAAKWQGWSVNAELFLRWISNLKGDGPVPTTQIFQRGFYVEGGRFIVPQKLDLNWRYSHVAGPFGRSDEYAIGTDYYPTDTPKVKISFDVTRIEGCPVTDTPTDLFAGDTGTLFRTQFQSEF